MLASPSGPRATPSRYCGCAAVRLAESLPPPEQARVLGPLLSDPLLAVRIEAARAAAGFEDSLTAEQRAAWQRAAAEYLATLGYTADRPEARVALGSFQSRLRRHDAAQAAFAQAIALDPAFVPAYLNAADDLRAQKRDAEGRQLLQQGLAHAPKDAALHYALGLTLGPPRRTVRPRYRRWSARCSSPQASRATRMCMRWP